MGGAKGGTGPAPLDSAAFRERTGVSRETLDRLAIYAALLVKWQRAVNLVARDSLPDLWRRHMLDSAQLMALLPPAPRRRPRVVVDLGSGAGFPGMVLAILGAGEVHLIESHRRTCAFLAEVARATGTRVLIHAARAEDLAPWPAHVVTARALAPLDRLLGLAAPYLAPGGVCLFPKGRGVEEELTAAGKEWKMRVERIPSVSDPAGTILRLGNISRGRNRR
ncbi:MAG: 16S rRNA (guanine(527)-N(7))-methyltransferase RsmG [Planctomycetota bacterium]